jgi:hypothetical protein
MAGCTCVLAGHTNIHIRLPVKHWRSEDEVALSHPFPHGVIAEIRRTSPHQVEVVIRMIGIYMGGF